MRGPAGSAGSSGTATSPCIPSVPTASVFSTCRPCQWLASRRRVATTSSSPSTGVRLSTTPGNAASTTAVLIGAASFFQLSRWVNGNGASWGSRARNSASSTFRAVASPSFRLRATRSRGAQCLISAVRSGSAAALALPRSLHTSACTPGGTNLYPAKDATACSLRSDAARGDLHAIQADLGAGREAGEDREAPGVPQRARLVLCERHCGCEIVNDADDDLHLGFRRCIPRLRSSSHSHSPLAAAGWLSSPR